MRTSTPCSNVVIQPRRITNQLLLTSVLLAGILALAPERAAGQCAPDIEPPLIGCLADSTVSPSGPDGAEVLFTVIAVDNCDSFPSVTCSPASGSLFPIGTTLVECTATDSSANGSSCSFNITVSAPRASKMQVRDELAALRSSATSDFSKFDSAIRSLDKSLEPGRWTDDSRPKKGKAGEDVFNAEKSAVKEMVSLLGKYPAVEPLIHALVDIDRLIAEIAIADAMARDGNATKILEALECLDKGDQDAAAGKFDRAIDDYKNAWKKALSA